MVCHGPDGKGGAVRIAMPAIPDFTNGGWHQARSNSQLVASVLNGKGTLMPSWQGRISPGQARDLVEFLRTFGPERLVASAAPAGAFGTQFNKLSQQWDELESRMKALTPP